MTRAEPRGRAEGGRSSARTPRSHTGPFRPRRFPGKAPGGAGGWHPRSRAGRRLERDTAWRRREQRRQPGAHHSAARAGARGPAPAVSGKKRQRADAEVVGCL